MSLDQDLLAGCRREVQDCLLLLKTDLTAEDRMAVVRRLKDAERALRDIEDEILFLLME